jgi:hypothetical protein
MDRAYLLQHVRLDDDDPADVRVIGVYSSKRSAQAAIERLKDQPGFREYPESFTIDEYDLDADHWVEGFVGGTRRIDVPWWGCVGPVLLLGAVLYAALTGRWIELPFIVGYGVFFFGIAEFARRRAARIDYSQR